MFANLAIGGTSHWCFLPSAFGLDVELGQLVSESWVTAESGADVFEGREVLADGRAEVAEVVAEAKLSSDLVLVEEA